LIAQRHRQAEETAGHQVAFSRFPGALEGLAVESSCRFIFLPPPFDVSQCLQVDGDAARKADGSRLIDGPPELFLGGDDIPQPQIKSPFIAG
jgi:hypothetical protein